MLKDEQTSAPGLPQRRACCCFPLKRVRPGQSQESRNEHLTVMSFDEIKFFFYHRTAAAAFGNQSGSSRGRSGHHWGAVLNISTLLQGPLSQSRGRPANQEEITSGIPTTEASLPSQSLVSPNPLLLDTTGSRVHNYNPRQTDTHSCTSS